MAQVIIKGMEKLKKMSNTLDAFLEEATKQVMADIMLDTQSNTNKGLNIDRQPFIPYSKKTVKKKIEDGKSTTPNMQDTSAMLSSLDFLPARKSRTFIIYKIGVKGSHKGVSNKAKLKWLSDHKNYVILGKWPPYRIKMANSHINKAVKRFINKVS